MIKYSHWLFKRVLKNFSAITLPWGVYFRDSKELTSYSSILHELCHLQQIQEKGVARFYVKYLTEWAVNFFLMPKTRFRWLPSYYKLFFEIEAYTIEDKISKDLEKLTVTGYNARISMISNDWNYARSLVVSAMRYQRAVGNKLKKVD